MDSMLLVAALGTVVGSTICGGPGGWRYGGPGSRGEFLAPPAVHLTLNIPAYRLDVFEGAARTRSIRVAVGMRKYPTPVGRFVLQRVVWNPWWVPPKSDWARHERVTAPGPKNPLGKVKIQFQDLYYLHGTPAEESLGRAASHGCIRMANADAIDVARLVQQTSADAPAAAETDALATRWDESRTVELPGTIPLDIVYEVVEIRDGALEVYPDVYRRGVDVAALARKVLTAAGITPDRVDAGRLAELLRQGRRRHATIPLDSLVSQPSGEVAGPEDSAAR